MIFVEYIEYIEHIEIGSKLSHRGVKNNDFMYFEICPLQNGSLKETNLSKIPLWGGFAAPKKFFGFF